MPPPPPSYIKDADEKKSSDSVVDSLSNLILKAIHIMNFCMSDSPGGCCNIRKQAACPPVMQQQQRGEIYESAGVVFWPEKCCVTIAGRHWGTV